MNVESIDYLVQLRDFYSVPLVDLFSLYNRKISDYVSRDLRLGKAVDFFYAYEQGDRALNVVETYLRINYFGGD